MKPRSDWDRTMDRGFIWLTRIFAFAVAVILIWITVQVAIKAWPAITEFGFSFITSTNWDPVRNQYGALPQLYGTIASSAIALLIAVPVGIGVALFLSEDYLPPRIQVVIVFLVELLAAIPSVVYGLWGIFVLIPLLKVVGNWLNASLGWLPIFSTPLRGPGLLPAALVLAIMVLPTIAALSRDALISLPPDLRQASVGLGATRWETILKVLLPSAFSGIVGAVMLALGRALGETMAVTMLIGNSNNISPSILAPSNTIASLLANQFAEASGLQVAALMYAALILFVLTLLVNILAQILIERVQRI
ncbi:phosphate ABC transporter permease subunit PstC [Coleofasciculus sp. FACHB-T130]|uniref:phosphate ABC transporter permease subunit PstC n=1 Tax=Cyanophyceae TaxID=3028117 RepID=UPI001685BA5A|nr:phosphate ABC transporter permease subunit PstC [Coleofasciculus sp. FACHB-T130]MBD1879570.1 phosphate ABC transporter permease subunit PstC [Coleofasciculus sp. FACHB-T130]